MGRRYHGERVWEWGGGIMGRGCGSREEVSWGEGVGVGRKGIAQKQK